MLSQAYQIPKFLTRGIAISIQTYHLITILGGTPGMNGQGYQPGVDIMIHVCWLQGYYIFWESPTRKNIVLHINCRSTGFPNGTKGPL